MQLLPGKVLDVVVSSTVVVLVPVVVSVSIWLEKNVSSSPGVWLRI